MIARSLPSFWALIAVLVAISAARGQATQPSGNAPTIDTTLTDLTHLRDALNDAYNRGDVERMLSYLHPDVLIIFPDARVLNGREALRAYYQKMLTGPSPVVSKYTADPIVDGRQFRGDVDLSWGRMNDHYVLTNGMEFSLNSRFTVTVVKSPEGPPDTGGWMIRSFHSSTDAFDNPILRIAAKRAMTYAGIGGLAIGIVAGALATRFLRHRRTDAANPR